MNPALIKVRSLARKWKVIQLINRLRPRTPYEERFHQVLVAGIKPGDVVWDIGANVGLYTEQFCEWVGDKGWVVAFEPGAESCAQIRERLKNCSHVTIENVALAEEDMVGELVVNAEYSVSNHIRTGSEAAAEHEEVVPVTISRADTAAKRLGRVPNVIKIDVEGFEEVVLSGFGTLLREPELRSVFVEVHFSELEKRGWAMAPVRIEKLLKSNGFQVKWADPSHLSATR